MSKTSLIESSLTVLVVSNLERSFEFYQNKLGFDEVNEYWVLREGRTGLGLKLLQAKDRNQVKPNSTEDEIIWDVYAYPHDFESLDILYDEFKNNGVIFAEEPRVEEHSWGKWKEFSIKDPDGYVIAFGSALK